MSAFKAHKPSDAPVARSDVMTASVPTASRLGLADGTEPAGSNGAHALQAHLRARLNGASSQSALPSPSRGLLIAAVPSALLWWGIVSGVRALMHL